MKPKHVVSLALLFILAAPPLASWGGYDGHYSAPPFRTPFKKYRVGSRLFSVYQTAIPVALPAYAPVCGCPATTQVSCPAQALAPAPSASSSGSVGQSNQAASYTSDSPPLVPVGNSDGVQQLFYSYNDDTYWLIGAQSSKGLTKDQAAEYIQKHPSLFKNSDSDINPSSAQAPAAKTAVSGRDAAIALLTSQVPATVTVPDMSKPPGWADYDGDGIIDEIFPQEKTIANPDYIKALKDLGAEPPVSETIANSTSDDSGN